MYIWIIILIVIAVVVVFIFINGGGESGPKDQDRPGYRPPYIPPPVYMPPERMAGERGERIAEEIIRSVLRPDDLLFTNVEIEYDGKPAELDCVVVNTCGVFIFEVKNYSGTLYGGEDDYEWVKGHVTEAGNIYRKIVKNPIRQVKRQIYLLASYLRYYGVDVWVEGYVLLLERNSPVESSYLLDSAEGIGRAVHRRGRNRLDGRAVERIGKLLE